MSFCDFFCILNIFCPLKAELDGYHYIHMSTFLFCFVLGAVFVT